MSSSPSDSDSSLADSTESDPLGNPFDEQSNNTEWTWWEIYNYLTGEKVKTPTIFKAYRKLGFLEHFHESYLDIPVTDEYDENHTAWQFEPYYPHDNMPRVMALYRGTLDPFLQAAYEACRIAQRSLDQLAPENWVGKHPNKDFIRNVILHVQEVLIQANKIHEEMGKVSLIKRTDQNNAWGE